MKQPFVILFAGVPGTSKSIVAHHLSTVFLLPIFSTDIIRFEVKEDLLIDDITQPQALKEYEKRHDSRWRQILQSQQPFIYDASMDRRWPEVKDDLTSAGYAWCLIDMELSLEFVRRLYERTGRHKALGELDAYMRQHQAFMMRYEPDTTIQVVDNQFADRRSLAEGAVRAFIEGA